MNDILKEFFSKNVIILESGEKIIFSKEYSKIFDELEKVGLVGELNKIIRENDYKVVDDLDAFFKNNNSNNGINNINNDFCIGNIIFINIRDLCSSSIRQSSAYDFPCYVYSRYSGLEVENYLENNIEDDILVAVKYIGNGIFEEIITHEKFCITDMNYSIYNYNNNSSYSKKIKDCNIISLCPIDYLEYLQQYDITGIYDEDNKILSRTQYIELIIKNIKLLNEYPLGINSAYPSYSVDKNSVEIYKKYDDEKRKSIIFHIMELAKHDNEIVQENLRKKVTEMNGTKKNEMDNEYEKFIAEQKSLKMR